jgi:hypothetical protein
MSKRTHDCGIEMVNSGICLQSILYYLGLSDIMCHGACNCSHRLNECVRKYRNNGWYNLGNIINNVIRFGASQGLTPAQLRIVYEFLNTQLKMIYKAQGLAAQGLLINTSGAEKYLVDGHKPEGAKAPRIEVLEVAVV